MKYSIFVLCLFYSFVLDAQISSNITVVESDITISQQREYNIISWNQSEYYSEQVGAPQLPVIVESFVVPLEAKVTGVIINSEQKYKLSENSWIFPAQPAIAIGNPSTSFVEPDTLIYNSISSYPQEKIKIIADTYEHGYHIVTIESCPFKYIPKLKTLYLCNLTYSINYVIGASNYEYPLRQSSRRAMLANSFIRSKVKNTNDILPFSNKKSTLVNTQSTDLNDMPVNSLEYRDGNSAIEKRIPEYFIITNQELKPIFQLLADWKTKKGIPAVIKTTEEIKSDYAGADLAEKIRNYLKECRRKWGDDFFVLLGGDSNIVPARIATNGPDRRDTYKEKTDTYTKDSIIAAQDLYYTALDGNWNLNGNHVFNEYYQYQMANKKPSVKYDLDRADFGRDLYLGRAAVNDGIEACTFVNKVITYEKANADIDYEYINNSLAADAFIEKAENGKLSNDARSTIDRYYNKYPVLNRWLIYDHYNCTCNKHWAYVTDSPGEEFNKINFISALQNGGHSGMNHFHIVYHMDHSGPTAMGTSSKDKNQMINNLDADAITNGKYYQIIFSSGCNPVTFNQDCIAEHFFNNPNGGAVAFIGNADRGWANEYYQFGNFLSALYSSDVERYDLGYAFQKAMGRRDTANCRLTLLGDPEMPVWTATPQDLDITVTPNELVNEAFLIGVKINTPLNGKKALICLMKGDEGYTTLTVNDNSTHLFKFTPRTSGSVDVTVTAHNFRPFETTIPVKVNENSSICIENLVFDDDKTGSSVGNGDKQLDAGETIEVTIDLKNNGKTTASNVSAVLTCNSADIQIINGDATFGDIPANGIKSSLDKFVFKINKDATERSKNDSNPVKFLLDITGNEHTSYEDDFNVDILASELGAANQEILSTTNGNKIIEPNETVTFSIDLMNYGKAVATGVTGKLTSTSPYITDCSTVSRSYPNINKHETKTSTGTFQFKTTSSYVKGQPLPFQLEVKNEFDKTWQLEIDPANRPAKLNSSTINFAPYESEIDLFWTKVTNASGYNIYKSENGINGSYHKLNTFPVQFAYYKDAELNLYSTYYYKVSAISAKGNESELSNPVKAWTSCPLMGLFPVSLGAEANMQGPINVADINNDGKKEIFSVTRFNAPYEGAIIGLNADGTDLFDIDGNVTTHNGFANVKGSLWGIPALGDLKADGETQVVVATRSNSSGINQVLCYSTKDKDGDHFPDLLWAKDIDGNGSFDRGSIIANLDNSSDGTQEVITFSCDYLAGITIYDCDGNKLKNFGNYESYGMPAVADLDGDGDKEIVLGARNGLYIWHHDGRNFSTNPFYAKPDLSYWFCSSPVVCDIDNDGEKEILIAAKKNVGNNDLPSIARIYAFKMDGTFADGWNETQEMPIPNPWYARDLSVGDLNGDGNLEVVLLGTNMVRVWTNTGKVLFSKTINGLTPTRITPILADIDGDPDIEIVFGADKGTNRYIYAINPDGSDVVGFPLQMDDFINSTLCVADIDNDGKNELMANVAYSMFAWKTEGRSDRIEWGSERHDAQNTGEYTLVCHPLLIASDLVWSGKDPCGDVVLESGTLTVNSSNPLTLSDGSILMVKSGATLEVDGGSILNANIKALSGSKVILKNNGRIKLRSFSDLIIDKGAELDYESGSLE